jgi:hypothetical protein
VTGAYLPLTGGTLYNPAQNTALGIQSDAGHTATITAVVSGIRSYSFGCWNDGNFNIFDNSAGSTRLQLNVNGQNYLWGTIYTFNPSGTYGLSVTGGIVCSNILSVIAGGAAIQGNVTIAGNGYGLTAYNSGIYSAGTLTVASGGINIQAGGTLTVNSGGSNVNTQVDITGNVHIYGNSVGLYVENSDISTSSSLIAGASTGVPNASCNVATGYYINGNKVTNAGDALTRRYHAVKPGTILAMVARNTNNDPWEEPVDFLECEIGEPDEQGRRQVFLRDMTPSLDKPDPPPLKPRPGKPVPLPVRVAKLQENF